MRLQETVASLLERAKSGERAAFETLSQHFDERLASFVRSHMSESLRRRMGVEDVVQETCLRAFQSIGVFRGNDEKSYFSWLASIAEHLIWNAARKRSLKEAPHVLDTATTDLSPSRGLRRKERLSRLRESLASLKADQREVVILAKIEGLNSKEIAERLGRKEGTVRQLLSRSLYELRRKFGDTESLHLPDERFEEGAEK